MNIAITWKKKKNKSGISDIPETFWDKVPDFTDDPVLQCDVPTVKNTILDDGNNDDHKKILIGLNALFLELILCIVLVS